MISNHKNISIRQLLERLFIFVTLFILIITFVGAFYFNNRSIQILRETNIKNTHEILASLLVPALKISDSTEIRRFLKMSSNANEIFAVFDENNTIFLSDYSLLALIKAGINDINANEKCKENYNHYYHFKQQNYLLHCSPLFNDDLMADKRQIGTLISLSPYSWLTFSMSPMMLYFFSITLIGLFVTVGLLRYVFNKRIVSPLLELNHYIVSQAAKPLAMDNSKLMISRAYQEVVAIKNGFEKVVLELKDEYHQRSEFEKKTALFDLAAHVAHDIRSSLTVIEITIKAICHQVSLDQIAILNEAIQNVRYTLNNLLDHYRNTGLQKICKLSDENSVRTILLSNILNLVILQKSQEWKINPCNLTLNIADNAKLKWIHASANDIKRLLSNVLNNAYESLRNERKIIVSLLVVHDQLQLTISDTGHGIPLNKINEVLNGTSLKHSGKGMGLSSANRLMQELGGSLKLSSELDHGTEVDLKFPMDSKPSWFPEYIAFSSNRSVIVLDDDVSIHHLWRDKLRAHDIEIQYFHQPEKMLEWYRQHIEHHDQMICLIDYELNNESYNGLDILRILSAKNNGYLITNHANNSIVQDECEKIGVWLVPKNAIGEIPLQIFI